LPAGLRWGGEDIDDRYAQPRSEVFVIVLLFGPPGSGKGTQASFIASRYPIPAISTGEIFRVECKAGTPLGKQACSILAQGGLVGDEIVNHMVANRIGKPDCFPGFLLDGYPRTLAQAEFLYGLLRRKGLPEPTVIHLEVRMDMLVRRIAMRRQCPECSRIYNLLWQPPKAAGVCDEDGAALIRRQDDTEPVLHERLTAYEKLTGPVIAHYRGSASYHLVNGDRSPEEIQREIGRLLAQPAAQASARRGKLQFGLATPGWV
jgi:adenylate kinase